MTYPERHKQRKPYNCFNACLAYILDIDQDDFPYVYQWSFKQGRLRDNDNHFYWTWNKLLGKIGYELAFSRTPATIDYYLSVVNILDIDDDYRRGLHLKAMRCADGGCHAVVGRGDDIVFDPCPGVKIIYTGHLFNIYIIKKAKHARSDLLTLRKNPRGAIGPARGQGGISQFFTIDNSQLLTNQQQQKRPSGERMSWARSR